MPNSFSPFALSFLKERVVIESLDENCISQSCWKGRGGFNVIGVLLLELTIKVDKQKFIKGLSPESAGINQFI